MCHGVSDLESFQTSCYTDLVHRPDPEPSKTAKAHVVSLRRRNGERLSKERAKLRKLKKIMKMKNLKLYMENKTIIEENEKLRKQALLLHQENKALFSQMLIQQVSQNPN
ncbi:putative ankyrin repeat and zinc finger domain-containing protein 1-like [Capsicum annuum]|uniref:protein LITTLE ZIPPER 1 n=1 Tax=Capsicum annuum TaxID=4072 RepID=UPI0003E62A7B|nr:protein LITTLE ZIPPER 1 [Capsicum annuum]KAF3682675.1 putative ankyrin repeat and zinc finger domain-containing protein 1-like [Capsicum annuum]KAF3684948.1 putative ankyrin repeat and zinc finger domain-containing protein 1-like [Capsicum annuum]